MLLFVQVHGHIAGKGDVIYPNLHTERRAFPLEPTMTQRLGRNIPCVHSSSFGTNHKWLGVNSYKKWLIRIGRIDWRKIRFVLPVKMGWCGVQCVDQLLLHCIALINDWVNGKLFIWTAYGIGRQLYFHFQTQIYLYLWYETIVFSSTYWNKAKLQ